MLAQQNLPILLPTSATSTMRYLAIDFGERRIGVAVSDDDERLAVPVGIVDRHDDRTAIGELRELAQQREAQGLVVGRPTTPDGDTGESEPRIRRFAERLARATKLPIHWIDETLTTVEAERMAHDQGRKSGSIDDLAASLLLQDWLDHRRQH